MGWLSTIFARPKVPDVHAQASMPLNSPAFYEFMRSGGTTLTAEAALKNTAVLRCVTLIASGIGSLPLRMTEKQADGKIADATSHPLYRVFRYKPNHFQSAMQFKRLMQGRALVRGAAYARIVRTNGTPTALIPITADVQVEQGDDLSPSYQVSLNDGRTLVLPAREVFVLDAMSLDGVKGLAPVALAADVINTAVQAQAAANRIFETGVMAGGALRHKGKLSPEAQKRLVEQMAGFSGTANAGKWFVLEEDMDGKPWDMSAQSAQLSETRAGMVEEIARVFGVPRPLLMIDDTSWGSGIEQLAILFVRFTLAPWFTLWEDEARTKLLRPDEWGRFEPDFDERELLRGTLKDQAEFFARALGSGGTQPWMEANEVRELSGLGAHKDGSGLVPAGGKANDKANDPGLRT